MDVGTKVLRSRLSEILDRVQRGERVVVRRRGKAAVQLVPLQAGGTAGRLPSLKDFRARFRVKGKPLSDTVSDLRSERDA
jgi:prevent-host-death family protein